MTENRDSDEIPEEIVLPIEDSIDLHPFRPKEIRSVVESYLEEALAAGFSEVRLIHGRGIGVQREIVRSLLSRHPRVDGYRDAPSERGGWGATVVRLASGGASSD
jgi:dsDNA-specific endonuclease/ATPase MutS2